MGGETPNAHDGQRRTRMDQRPVENKGHINNRDEILRAEEWHDQVMCPLCHNYNQVSVKTDQRCGRKRPYCTVCGVFLIIYWKQERIKNLKDGTLYSMVAVHVTAKAEIHQPTELTENQQHLNEIPHHDADTPPQQTRAADDTGNVKHPDVEDIDDTQHSDRETDDVEHNTEHNSENAAHTHENVEHYGEHNDTQLTDDHLAERFISTHIVAETEHFLTSQEVYTRYQRFIHKRNRTPIEDRRLYKRLRERYPVATKKRRRINGRLQYGFTGIRCRD